METNNSKPTIKFSKDLLCDVCGYPGERLKPIKLSDFNSEIMICEECVIKFYGKNGN